jgi:hypothetical protein
MYRLQKYNWAFNTIALFLLFGIAIYLLLRKPTPKYDQLVTYLKQQNKNLETKNKELEYKIKILANQKNQILLQIDSLNKLKNKVKYVYIKKDREIDTMGVGSIVNEFKTLFAKDNRKRK